MLSSTVTMKSGSVSDASASGLDDLGFSASDIEYAHRVLVTAGANPVRYAVSGDDPTSTVGHYVAANESVELDRRPDIQELALIGVGGASVVTVTLWSNQYWRESLPARGTVV